MATPIEEEVLWVLNDPEIWASLECYINYRIKTLREKNDNASGEQLLKNQGAIAELKELIRFREQIKSKHDKRQ